MFQSLLSWILHINLQRTYCTKITKLLFQSLLSWILHINRYSVHFPYFYRQFQSLLSWILHINKMYLANIQRWNWFQSLLSWILHINFCNEKSVTSDEYQFQSLLSWILHINFRIYETEKTMTGVSILVILDSPYKYKILEPLSKEVRSFNPCYLGFSI